MFFVLGLINIFILNSDAALYGKSGFVPVQAPKYIDFYDIDTMAITAKFNNLSADKEKSLSGSAKDLYKKSKKIEKYISENNYEKAIKEEPNFLPSHIKYYNYFVGKNDVRSAMNEMITIKRLNSLDRVLDDNVISYKLGMLYYLNKDYSVALGYLSNFINAHNPSEENLWFALADIYYNLKNYDSSIENAKKIPSTSINYLPIQSVLYNDYYALNNIQEANKCANVLVQREPIAANYIKLAQTSGNNDASKLNIYNKARNLALEENDIESLLVADAGIALIEQAKIDNAVSKLTGFIEKPTWMKIQNSVSAITDPIELSKRQDNFFKSTNYCIQKFSNQDLIKCFEYVNKEENKISEEIIAKYKEEYQRQMDEYDMMRRQQEFLERTYYNRLYMDEFYYMREPYNYFFGNYW